MRLVFATENKGKIREASAILPNGYQLVTLSALSNVVLPEETAHTLEGNALIKARYIYDNFGMPCFADDTGLFINALQGAPGVHTARYAGDDASDRDNMELLLENLKGKKDRKAYFKTVIALLISGREFLYDGVLHGTIADKISGSDGFGYDPVFIPQGYDITLADMGQNEKNTISHRRQALLQMAKFLE